MSEWISIKDKFPMHGQLIFAYSKTTGRGTDRFAVSLFIDAVKMNKVLSMGEYANECVDVKKDPYYFVSQEITSHVFKNISHWMPLPDPP